MATATAAISSLDAELARGGNETDQQMTDTPNDAASTPKSASVAPSINGANNRATITLMFGDEDCPDNYNIPSRDLEKLPQSTLDSIISSSHAIGGGSRKIYQFEDTSCVETLMALKRYLRKGDHWPATITGSFQASDAEGNIFQWSKADDGTRTKAVSSTDATHGVFLKETRMYSFAVTHSYPDLRKFSAHKICTLYPLFIRETIVLLDRVYRPAFELKDESPEDHQMYATIMDLVQKHRAELVRLPEFLDLLRRSISNEPLGRMLLDFYIDVTSDNYADALLATIPVKTEPDGPEHNKAAYNHSHQAKEVVQRPASPVDPRERTPKASTRESLCYQLPALVDAIQHGYLMVASKAGYGTLVRSHAHYDRNRDFRFEENELLIYLHDGRVGKRNAIVQNARGEIGDIIGTTIRPVMEHLGSTEHGDAVNCGRPLVDHGLNDGPADYYPPTNRPKFDRPSVDRPLIDRFDRDPYMNDYFPPRTPLGRSRSRSPRRPIAYDNHYPYPY